MSNEAMKAMNAPAAILGAISGGVTVRKANHGRAPRARVLSNSSASSWT